jgi:uncharacterized membrane protein
MFPATVCSSISLRWSEEDILEVVRSINISSLQDENPVTRPSLKKNKKLDLGIPEEDSHMNLSYVLLLAFLIGVIGGLRTMTAPAVVAWAANRHWLNLDNSPLALIGSLGAVLVFTLGALGELVIDKLPSTPNRTRLLGLVGRSVLGGLSGAAVAVAGAQSIALGIVAGVAGAIAGAFAGYEVRKRLVRALKVPDFVIALLEDAVAIGGGLLIVSRF